MERIRRLETLNKFIFCSKILKSPKIRNTQLIHRMVNNVKNMYVQYELNSLHTIWLTILECAQIESEDLDIICEMWTDHG